MTDELVPESLHVRDTQEEPALGDWQTAFDIRAEARRLMRSGEVDAERIAGLLMGYMAMDAVTLRRALRAIIVDWVRLEQSRVRVADRQIPVPPAPTIRTKRAEPRLSAKIEKTRALALDRRLNFTVHDPVVGGQKLFRDCTAEDLLALAKESRELAKANLAVAHNYEQWAEAVEKAKVRTVGDLPLEIVEKLCRR